MNNDWKLETERIGQNALGYIEMYKTSSLGHNIRALVNYLPQLPNSNYERTVLVTLFITGEDVGLRKSFYTDLFNSLCGQIKAKESIFFINDSEAIDAIHTQTYFVKELPDLKYNFHSDFGIIVE